MSLPKPRVLFLIPARGGSKGLPGKNIRMMNGKPLISWTIQTALQAAKAVDGRVIVSTDDKTIADTAVSAGAEIPFLRPAHLAEDTSTSVDVVLHALDFLQHRGETFDYVCMLEATSPQRDDKDVLSALNILMRSKRGQSIVGVCRSESGHPSFLALMNEETHEIGPYEGEQFIFKRRQEIDDVYFFEGSMYISRVDTFRNRKSYYHENTLGYEMPKWKSFEVDDIIDFIIIERLMKAREEGLVD